jgi:hypothetical protein
MQMIHEAGWPIYPVLLFGAAALFSSLSQLREPRREKVPLCVGLIAATVMMGLLGMALGLDPSARAILERPVDQRWIFFEGMRESLNNLDVALLFSIAATLLTALGSQRMHRAPDDVVPVAR